MFDQRKFWLAVSVFVLMIGAVITAAGAAFNAFVGMPTKEHRQVVTQSAPIQAAVVNELPFEIKREVAAPAAIAQSPLVHCKVAADAAVATPQIAVPASLVLPERKPSTKRDGRPYKRTAALAHKRR